MYFIWLGFILLLDWFWSGYHLKNYNHIHYADTGMR